MKACSLIPVVVCFKEGGKFVRTFITAEAFTNWKQARHLFNSPPLVVQTWTGTRTLHVPIIMTMNGFVYDKIYEYYTGSLLRERKDFSWDINNSPRL